MDALSTQISSRRFETVKRGYDPEAVNSYLARIGEQVAKLEDALRVGRSRIEDLERRTPSPGSNADTVVKTAFLAAADAKAKMIAEAEARAAQIIAEAETRASEVAGANARAAEVESLLMEARRRLEESERHAQVRREEAEREAEEIIAAAKTRVAETSHLSSGKDPVGAADELNRLLETLGSLKQVARDGLEQAESLGAEIESVIGDH